MLRLLVTLLSLSAPLASADAPIDLVRVIKSEHKLQLVSSGIVQREFHIALGGNPNGHKSQEGDGKTPEGIYTLDYKKSDSAFTKAFHISYPNAADVAAAKTHGNLPGGQIMIHGQKNGLGWLAPVIQHFNWTNGCIALKNEDIDTLWSSVKEGTTIEIRP